MYILWNIVCPCVGSRFYICYATSSVCMYGVDYISLWNILCPRVWNSLYIFIYVLEHLVSVCTEYMFFLNGISCVRVYGVGYIYISLWNIVCPCVRRFHFLTVSGWRDLRPKPHCIVSLYIAFHPDTVSVFFMGSQMCAERTRKYDFSAALECLECPLFTPPSSLPCVTSV